MADVSGEMKGLIIAITFLSTFFIVASFIPSGFQQAIPGSKEVEVPDYFESVDVQFFSDTYDFNITFDGGYYFLKNFDLGGWHLRLRAWKSSIQGPGIRADHYRAWWIFTWNHKNFDWYDAETGINYGDWLSLEELDTSWDNESSMVGFNVKTDEVQMRVYFGFNTTEYAKPSDAFNDSGLSVLWAIGFDQLNTSINAWNLIGSILFFQMPNVHPVINALIAIPIWTLMAYLIYVLILKAIPFVGG